jgi:DNA-binding GntR family transcriptional regulator
MPGTRLIELDLASEYGVSRTIVREVMKQLAAEGMIDLVPYKGATVAKTSIRDLEEIYRIQQDLEGLAAYLATPRLSKKDISQLERVHQESKSHADGDAAQWQRWNTRFHRVLIENCGNRRLIKLVEGHQDQFARYWFLLLSIPGRIEQSIQEHKEIIKAVKAEDPERVRFLMEQHFQGAAERLLDIIRNVYPSSFTI